MFKQSSQCSDSALQSVGENNKRIIPEEMGYRILVIAEITIVSIPQIFMDGFKFDKH